MANGDSGDVVSPYTAADKIRDIYVDIQMYGFSMRPAFAFGRVEPRMQTHAEANGIEIASKSVYMSPKSLSHARRKTKVGKGIDVSIDAIAKFPKTRYKMDLYWDGECYVYTDYRNKFIIHPNYRMTLPNGKLRKVAFITAGRVTDVSEFNVDRYEKI